MAKKGTIIISKNHRMKGIYIHRNSEVEKTGKKVVKLIRTKGIEGLNRIYDNLVLVKEEDPMTPDQVEAYKKYIPEQVWKPELTWTEALGYTKDAVAPLMDEYPYQCDYTDFIPSWRSRYQYFIDLDRNEFQVAIYGLELIGQESDEFFKTTRYPHKIKAFVAGRFPLDAIPENWQEIVHDAWNHTYLSFVPMDAAAIASGNGDFPIEERYKPEVVQFYLGMREE